MHAPRRTRSFRRAVARRHSRDHTRRSDEPIRRKTRRPLPHHLRYLGRALDAVRFYQWD